VIRPDDVGGRKHRRDRALDLEPERREQIVQRAVPGAQQVPPVPSSSHDAKKSSAVDPGSGPGSSSAVWISFSELSNGTAAHHVA
jgi:hypothetical protein